MGTKTETMWAIAYPKGLYVGTQLTRAAMIAEHVYYKTLPDEEPTKQSPGLGGTALDALQKERWNECRKRGDRAVKVTVSYDYEPA